jgi:hypothetical protein
MDYTGRNNANLWRILDEEVRSSKNLTESIGILSLWSVYRLCPNSGVLQDINYFYQETKKLSAKEITDKHGQEFQIIL